MLLLLQQLGQSDCFQREIASAIADRDCVFCKLLCNTKSLQQLYELKSNLSEIRYLEVLSYQEEIWHAVHHTAQSEKFEASLHATHCERMPVLSTYQMKVNFPEFERFLTLRIIATSCGSFSCERYSKFSRIQTLRSNFL